MFAWLTLLPWRQGRYHSPKCFLRLLPNYMALQSRTLCYSVLILSSHLRPDLQNGNLRVGFAMHFVCISNFPYACYMSRSSSSPVDHTNNIWWRVPVTKLFIMKFSPSVLLFLCSQIRVLLISLLLSSFFVFLLPSSIFSLAFTLHRVSFPSLCFHTPSPLPPRSFILPFFLPILFPLHLIFLVFSYYPFHCYLPPPFSLVSSPAQSVFAVWKEYFMCLSSSPRFLRLVSLHVKLR